MKAKVGFLKNVVLRLEHVADSFFKLAQRRLTKGHPVQPTTDLSPDSSDTKPFVETVWHDGQHMNFTPFSNKSGPGFLANSPSHPNRSIPSRNGVSPGIYSQLDSRGEVNNDIGSQDFDNFLNWLPAEVGTSRTGNSNALSGDQISIESTGLDMELSIPSNGLVDSTFDWLSWDTAWDDFGTGN